MDEFLILREVGLAVVAAAAAGLLARAVRVPALLAWMVAGVILGPLGGLVRVTEHVALLSEAGIALLLFLVGLELRLSTVRDVGRIAVLAGLGQALLSAGGGYALARLFGLPVADALVLAAGLTFSSTVVALDLLGRRGELQTLHGRLALGVLLLQDLLALLSLTLSAGLGRAGAADGVAHDLVVAFAGMTLLLLGGWVLVRMVLVRLFTWLAAAPEALFVCSLAWCFLYMAGAAAAGLSVEIGAFIAGVTLAQLPHTHELRRRVQPLAGFFMAVFFVALGAQMDPAAALRRPWLVLVLTLFVLLLKPGVLLALLARLRQGSRSAFLTALTLAQVSEFSFLLAALGVRDGWIRAETLAVLAAVGLISIALSALGIQHGDAVYDAALRAGALRLLRAHPEGVQPQTRRRGHIIIVGLNTLGLMLVRELAARGETVLAIDTDAGKLRDLSAETLEGSAEHSSLLRDADLPTAKLLISTLKIEDANNLLAWRCREAGVPCAIHAFDGLMSEQLRALDVACLMVSKHDGIRQMAGALRDAGVIA